MDLLIREGFRGIGVRSRLVWGFSCQAVVLGSADSFLFGAGKAVFRSLIAPQMAREFFRLKPFLWLRLQMAYDLAQARRHEGEIKVKRVSRRKLEEPRP